jgi:hypothetical protein
MSVAQTLHAGFANTATWFLLAIGIWATVQGLRNRALGPSWFGAVIIAELLLLVQAGLGAYLYFFTPAAAILARPFMHILYGIVAIITLPSAWGYFSNIDRPQVVSLAMGLTCIFLWGIVQRSATTALYPFPGG